MKITKRQLRRLIREAWDNEQWNRSGANWESEQSSLGAAQSEDEWYELLSNAFMAHTGGGAIPPEELPTLISALNIMATDLQNELDHPEDY